MKFTKILSLALALIILMSCIVFAIPASAAPATYYPKLNIRVTKTEEDNAYVAFKTYGGSDAEIIYEWDNDDEEYHTLEGGNYLNVDMDCSEYFYYVHVDEYYRHPITGESTLLNSVTVSSTSYEFYYKDGYYYDVTFIRGSLRPTDEYSYCVSNPDLFFYPVETVDVSDYTSVLDDLTRDPLFKIADYPSITDDYSLDVIQIAESVDGDLFVYVYNPSDATVEVEASKINMSLQHYEDKNPTYKLYDLTLVSSSGTLDKYVVNGFTVSTDDYRYYNIAGIYTPFNEAIHEDDEKDDNTVNYVGIPVGKCFEAITYEGNVYYACKKIDYVDVTINDHGIIRLQDSFGIFEDYNTDSHYIAISINNFDVTKIYAVDVSFYTQSYYYHYDSATPLEQVETYGDPVLNNKQITYAMTAKNEGGGFLGTSFASYDYVWDRIMTPDDFIAYFEACENKELIDYDAELIKSSDYVICFYESPYTHKVYTSTITSQTTKSSTIVSEVTLLRMHFASIQGVYNLGVVSDMVTDDGEPDIETTPGDNLQNQVGDYLGDDYDDLAFIVGLLILVVGLVALSYVVPFVKTILSGLIDAISFLIQLLVSLITLPFELLASIFGSDKPGKKRGKRK